MHLLGLPLWLLLLVSLTIAEPGGARAEPGRTRASDIEALQAIGTTFNLNNALPAATNQSLAWSGDPCTDAWTGISCQCSTPRDCAVIGLDLGGKLAEFDGQRALPAELSQLSALRWLNLSHNSLR